MDYLYLFTLYIPDKVQQVPVTLMCVFHVAFGRDIRLDPLT